MMSDPASLDRLHDIVVPAAVPWWPPAPGWLWFLAAVMLGVLGVLVRVVIGWQQNRYRREALAELARLEAVAADSTGCAADALCGLSELLKRTALTAFPRQQVAALTGPAWFEFLDRSGGTRFSAGVGAALEGGVYGTSDAATDLHGLFEEVRDWIRHHQVPSVAAPARSPSHSSARDARLQRDKAA